MPRHIDLKTQKPRDFSGVKQYYSHMTKLDRNKILKLIFCYFFRFNLDTIRQAYGMTEMTLTTTRIPPGVYRPGSSGKLVPLVAGKVRDQETGRSLGPNQIGELCWKVFLYRLKLALFDC